MTPGQLAYEENCAAVQRDRKRPLPFKPWDRLPAEQRAMWNERAAKTVHVPPAPSATPAQPKPNAKKSTGSKKG